MQPMVARQSPGRRWLLGLLLLLATSAPVAAGEYQITGGSGSGTVTRTFVDSSQQVDTISWSWPYGADDPWPLSTTQFMGGSLAATASESWTLTWVPDPGKTIAEDPPEAQE